MAKTINVHRNTKAYYRGVSRYLFPLIYMKEKHLSYTSNSFFFYRDNFKKLWHNLS